MCPYAAFIIAEYYTSPFDHLPNRIRKELLRLTTDRFTAKSGQLPFSSVVTYDYDNPRHLYLMVRGASNTVYAGGYFVFEMWLGNEYPMMPPRVRLMTKIWNPNYDLIGRHCFDMLGDKWSPALQVSYVTLQLSMSLGDERTLNFIDVMNNQIYSQYQSNPNDWRDQAREWTRLYATKEHLPPVVLAQLP